MNRLSQNKFYKLAGVGFIFVAVGAFAYFKSFPPVAEIAEINVALKYQPKNISLDPKNLETSSQFTLADNIFGRLIRRDHAGQFVADLPEAFAVGNDFIDFKFRDGLRDGPNLSWTADDARSSLIRLLSSEGGGHEDLRLVVCSDQEAVADCIKRAFVVEEKHFIIRVHEPRHLSHLIRMLDRADFSILHASSIDSGMGSLKSGYLQNTSGAYSVMSAEGLPLVLKANKYNHFYSPHMPQTIRIEPLSSIEALEKFSKGSIDLLPMEVSFASPAGNEVLKSSHVVYETLPAQVTSVVFTENAMQTLSRDERMRIGVTIGKLLLDRSEAPGSQQTLELFQPFTQGALESRELNRLAELRRQAMTTPLHRLAKVRIVSRDLPILQDKLRSDSNIELVPAQASGQTSLKSDLDAYVVVSDVSIDGAVAAIRYFGELELRTPKVTTNDWLRIYLNADSPEAQQKVVRDLHFTAMLNASAVPFLASPYFLVLRRGYSIQFDKAP